MEDNLLNTAETILNYSIYEMIVNLIISFFNGMVLSLTYQKTHKGLSYSQSFTQTIVLISVIVALIMMIIGGSLARAFALVGALSIVRFRTVLKDTKDLTYIFASLGLGMAAGTSNYYLSLIGLVFIILISIIFYYTNYGSFYKSDFILRFRLISGSDTSTLLEIMDDLCKRSNLIHVDVSADGTSSIQTYDISLKKEHDQFDLTSSISKLENISEVVLIAAKNDIDY
jgi:hypothetical protein